MGIDHAAALRALRRADLEWTARLSDVWRDPPADVPELHAAERAELAEELELLADRRDDRDGRSPLGRFVVGPGGSGKTHLLGALRRACLARGAAFVLVDMTDVKDFWQTTLQGFLDSLQEAGPDGRPQYRMLLDAVVRRASPGGGAAAFAEVGSRRTTDLAADVKTLLAALHRERRAEARRYQETLRALVCLNSDDWEISQTGYGLLQGQPVDPRMVAKLGFNGGRTPGGGTAAGGSDGGAGSAPGEFADDPGGISRGRRSEPRTIVRALSWVMSLAGPAVVAFDQLDPIVQQVRFRGGRDGAESGDPKDAAERAAARAILEAIGGGLGAMRDTVSRTLTVVACVEATWDLLRETVLSTNLDRFAPPAVLGRAAAPQIARTLVEGRLADAYEEAGFAPPHPTWPFAAAAFEDLVNQTPREVLKLCDAHRTACRRAGEVTELASFRADAPGPTPPATAAAPAGSSPQPAPAASPVADAFAALDGRFAELRAGADPAFLLEDKHEDERQAPLLRSVLKCLVREHAADLPADVDAEVEDRFPGGPNNALHARLRLTFVGEGNREEHHAVRALPRTNATAYQNRLKAATTGAGIDRDLGFRRLVIVRVPPPPSGRVTAQLTADFEAAGGQFFAPSDDQVRVLHALHRLLEERDPDFDDWLRARRPATAAGLGDALAPGSSLLSHESRDRQGAPPAPIEAEPRESDPPETVPDERDPAASPVPAAPPMPSGPAGGTPAPRFDSSDLPFGRRAVGGQPSQDWATAPVRALRKHTLVLGGAGAGKSVTLRRLVEEAALRGVPSIVVDHAGDLAAFDQDWPAPPDGWADGDAERAERFAALREQVVWTPGSVGGGNPLTLRPLPDFTPFADDPGGRADAVKMAAGGLVDVVARGSGRSASAKEGLLMSSLDYFARVLPAGGLDGFIGLLDDFPPDAGTGVKDEGKLAGQMADDLKSERAKNPLLGGAAGAIPLDPAVLFGDDRPRDTVRISVLSLAKLTEPARPAFLNQLATELFPWLRRHPTPPGGRALRGLLVIDEARDFVPSGKSTVCKESVMKLASQGRKYGLGLVLATQHPTEIDNRAVANCSTQLFGRANSPRAQEVVRNALTQAGGEGRDVGTLPVGRFYVSCPDAGLKPPVKAQIPMSLSRTPDNPLGEPELLAKADRDRQRLAAE